MRTIDCKTEYRVNPIGLDSKTQRLSWVATEGRFQTAFQIQIKRNGHPLLDTGKVVSDREFYLLDEKLSSRDHISWRVRLYDEEEVCGEWSEEQTFEMGLLCEEDWQGALWIGREEKSAADPSVTAEAESGDAMNRLAKKAFLERRKEETEVFHPHLPAAYLRKRFACSKRGEARLYISARGVYEASLNGKRVGRDVLTPGPANYHFEIPYQTYDVGDLLEEGENTLEILLGDGWYRSTSGVDGDRNLYGDRVSALAKLEVEKTPVVVTDASWEASLGALAQNDLQQGEVYDAQKEEVPSDDKRWQPVEVLGEDHALLKAGNAVPVRAKESFPGKLILTPAGERVIDFSQNMAGIVEFRVKAHAGQTITLLHGETLDENGNFTQENFEDRKRHKEGGTYQMIHYTCKEGENHYQPHFTVMGFRYVKVITDLSLEDAVFTAHAVYSDMEQKAFFTSENPLLNRLFENALWSLKGNFLGIPTDCPTRERAGWTGDAGIFVKTGLGLMNCETVFSHWLNQCRYGQFEDGRVANIAPPNNRPGMFSQMLAGSVGWGDACILVPYAIYRWTGDIRILKDHYEMMKKWYAFLENLAKAKGEGEFHGDPEYRDYTMETGINYGEWCEMGTTPEQSMRNGNYDVATAYFSYSGKLLAEIAGILQKEEEAKHYREVSENARSAFLSSFTDGGVIHSKRQCQYVRPISFGLLSEEQTKQAAADLNVLVEEMDDHLNTGFLTTPDLCGVLAENGFVATAYRLLLQEEMPGWLYSVRKGATTIWETWDGISKDGVPKDSLNHYAYGAIVSFLLDGVCGIHYSDRSTVIKPFVSKALGSASARVMTPKGEVKSGWYFEGDRCIFSIELPCNMQASVWLPNGQRETIGPGKTRLEITGGNLTL